MFGDNTNDNANGQQPYGGDQPTTNPPAGGVPADMSAPALPASDQPAAADTQQPAPAEQPEVTSYGANAGDAPAETASVAPADDAQTTQAPASTGANDLLDIKQQALQQLTPLVDHLDQSPKEEFRTTMMMIQATDNQDLVGKAFEAAKKIEDDKERAQAFLDIINEINYFTQHHEQQ
jgi:hypothetical protein